MVLVSGRQKYTQNILRPDRVCKNIYGLYWFGDWNGPSVVVVSNTPILCTRLGLGQVNQYRQVMASRVYAHYHHGDACSKARWNTRFELITSFPIPMLFWRIDSCVFFFFFVLAERRSGLCMIGHGNMLLISTQMQSQGSFQS